MRAERPPSSPPDSVRDFLAELLAEQGRLDTPVARFAAAHDAGSQLSTLSSQLIPLTTPGPGEQYAFEVDLDSCSGCKACVVACHALNGLEENESWRDVGLVHGGSHAAPFQQTVTTACHHCADPGCLNGCPVLAYEKDPITGIVRHLDDQCIGCQYCILKCPYDVPKYSERLGIVRKCDMCHNRLAEGEAPACVQACPTEAIKIVKIEIHVASAQRVDISHFLPGAPDPAYTQPTTRYLSQQPLPDNATAADAAALRPQPPHWPLVALLMLMPMAVGCGVADKILDLQTPALAVCGWVAGAAGLGLATLHLGQPSRAWKIFLNLRRSWFSREAVVFGLWFPLATLYVAARLGWVPFLPAGTLRSALAIATATVGVLGLFCSVMIYADTQRVFWRFANTAPRFFGTAVILGLAGALTAPGAPRTLGFILAAATLLKLAFEARAVAPIKEEDDGLHPPARQTARLLTGPLLPANTLRVVCALLGGMLLPFMVAAGAAPAVAAWPALGLALVGELIERYLFFRAVDAPKMPGSVRS